MATRRRAKAAPSIPVVALPAGTFLHRLVWGVARVWALPGVRIGALVVLIALLIYRLYGGGYSTSTWLTVLQPQALIWALAAVALLPVNLLLEVSKWRYLLASAGMGMAPHTGWAAILSGQALGFVTPNRVGEYPGRLLHIPRPHWLVAGLATHISRIGQLVGTLLGGAVGSLTLWHTGAVTDVWILPLAIGLLTVGFLLSKFILWPRSLRFLASVFHMAQLPLVISITEAQASLPLRALRVALGFSLVRYAVILIQYVALLCAFGYLGSAATGLALCSLVFVLKAVVPSIALSEMGIRETIALQVMGWMLIPTAICFNATVGLFVINLLLPAALGMLCVWRVGLQQKQTASRAFDVHP